MDANIFFVSAIIIIALIFDFTNGAHDAANSIATIVSTKVLTPKKAVLWAAFFNFIAFIFFGTLVAKTIGSGLINTSIVNPTVIFAGLMGSILWNIITWRLGLPTSSSHALIGGYAGAAIAKGGFGAIIIGSAWLKLLIFMVLSPLIGMFLGGLLLILTTWAVYKKPLAFINKYSRYLQFFSASLYSLGHGGNDAQKTMGIIVSLLIVTKIQTDHNVPIWVVLAANAAIAMGTLMGGWRIVKTMGQKIVKLRPIDGFCAESASAISIFLATFLGVPVSTTHIITGSISGVGAVKNVSAVKWGVTLRIVKAWFLTIPAAAITAGIVYVLTNFIIDLLTIFGIV